MADFRSGTAGSVIENLIWLEAVAQIFFSRKKDCGHFVGCGDGGIYTARLEPSRFVSAWADETPVDFCRTGVGNQYARVAHLLFRNFLMCLT